MATKQLKDSGQNQPLKKVKAGRFQISIWGFPLLLSSGEKDSTAYIEREVELERGCIQYSTYNRGSGQWKNQSIWCSIDELRDLARVVDKLNEEDEESSSSPLNEETKVVNLRRDVKSDPKFCIFSGFRF